MEPEEKVEQTQVPAPQPTPEIPPTPVQPKNSLILIMSILLIVTVAIALLFYFQIQKMSKQVTEDKTPVQTTQEAQTSSPEPTLKAGFKKYTNEKYSFEFIYPETYKILTDSNSLYGWPKAILLLYKGGQSYDMAVEVWQSETEYKEKYASQIDDITVFKNEGTLITLLNTNKNTEVTEIISTFIFVEASPSASPTSN